MIDNRFLHYTNETAFFNDYANGNIQDTSIVVVDDGNTVLPYDVRTEERLTLGFIWTHGKYYYGLTKERVTKFFELLEASNIPIRNYEDEEEPTTYDIASGDSIRTGIKKVDAATKYIFANLLKTDEDDITRLDDLSIQFKDIVASALNYHSYGYKILRKNINKLLGKNILTSSMFDSLNTIYEIKYDFDLNGLTITLPKNCALFFKCGLLSNGTIDLNNGYILGYANSSILLNVTINRAYHIDGTKYESKIYGLSTEMPSNEINGFTFYNTTLKKFCIFDGVNKQWVDVNGTPYSTNTFGGNYEELTNLVNNGFLFHETSGSWKDKAYQSQNRWMIKNEEGKWDVLASTDIVTTELDGLMSAADKIWLSGVDGDDGNGSAKERLNEVELELLAIRQDFIEGTSFLSNSTFSNLLQNWIVNYPALTELKRLRSKNNCWNDDLIEYQYQLLTIDDYKNALHVNETDWVSELPTTTEEKPYIVERHRTRAKETDDWSAWTRVAIYKKTSEIIQRSLEFFTIGLNNKGQFGSWFISFGSKENLYNILSDYHGESYVITKDGRSCICINNNFITLLSDDYSTPPTMTLTSAKTYSPIACTLDLYYYAETKGRLKVYFDGEEKDCKLSNVLPYDCLDYTEMIPASGEWKKLSVDFLWNGYGDFTIEYTGKIYIHTIVTKKDSLRTLESLTDKLLNRITGATSRFYGIDESSEDLLNESIDDTTLKSDLTAKSIIYAPALKCFLGVYEDAEGSTRYCNNWDTVDMYNSISFASGSAVSTLLKDKLYIFNSTLYIYDYDKDKLVRYTSDGNDHFVNVDEYGFYVCDGSGNIALKVDEEGTTTAVTLKYKSASKIS